MRDARLEALLQPLINDAIIKGKKTIKISVVSKKKWDKHFKGEEK